MAAAQLHFWILSGLADFFLVKYPVLISFCIYVHYLDNRGFGINGISFSMDLISNFGRATTRDHRHLTRDNNGGWAIDSTEIRRRLHGTCGSAEDGAVATCHDQCLPTPRDACVP